MREKFTTIEDFRKKYGIGFTLVHTGKMTGFMSLSTSPLRNTFCMARSKCPNSICSKCYSVTMNHQYTNLAKMLEKNLEVLTSRVIPVGEWPLVNAFAFRLESFGDVQNETQVRNYFNFCRRNPRVQFSVWTKNLPVYARVLKTESKPKNLIVIVSSPMLNVPVNPKNFPFVDKVFTVYTEDYAHEHGIKINCGARSCLACGRCYRKSNGVEYVNELLKKRGGKE